MNLDQLRKLCDGVTPGPWTAAVEMQEEDDRGQPLWQVLGGDGFVGDLFAGCNAAFIAAARTYLPRLIKVAEAAARIDHDSYGCGCDDSRIALSKALKELEAQGE